MPDPVDPQAFLNLCEMSIDNMYELEALGELLEEKGFIKKQQILDRAKVIKEQTHQSIPPSPMAQPKPNKENVVLEQIMEVILQSGLTFQQAKDLLVRTITILEWGRKLHPRLRISLLPKFITFPLFTKFVWCVGLAFCKESIPHGEFNVMITKIVSGGQTGADRGGLDAAIHCEIPHGGWCPKGRKAEDGLIPLDYNLNEMASPEYLPRTKANVFDSDATVIFTYGPLSGGSLKTATYAHHLEKPYASQESRRGNCAVAGRRSGIERP